MPKLTTPEAIEENLRRSYDENYYGSRRSLMRFVLGERQSVPAYHGGVSVSGEIPDDVDMMPRYYEPGQSRRILTNATLMMAKVCYADPDPAYPDKPRWKEIVTKSFNKALWKGRPYLGPASYSEFGEWAPEAYRCFLDGDPFGIGFVQIGVRDGWTTIQHHPLTRVVWDRYQFSVSKARYVAFVHYLPVETAVGMFGSDVEREAGSDIVGNLAGETLRVVKAIQWFDMGLGKSEPTECWRVRTFGGRVLDISENGYECLPFAHYQHMHLFGMRRPVGRADFQVAGQEMRNALERYMRMVLMRGPGFDSVDQSRVQQEDLQKLMDGELLALLRLNLPPLAKAGDVVQRTAAHEPPRGALEYMQYLDRMDPGESGISDADRANVTSSPRTLGEIQLTQSGADTQKQWSLRQYTEFQARLWHKANWIASKLHTAPTPISVQGVPVLFNDPADPRSDISYWLTPHSWPVVTEDSLQWLDPLRRAQIAQGKWLPLLSDPYMNPIEVRRAMIADGYGEKDVDRFLNPQAGVMGQGGIMGAPTDAVAAMGQQEGLPGGALAAPPM